MDYAADAEEKRSFEAHRWRSYRIEIAINFCERHDIEDAQEKLTCQLKAKNIAALVKIAMDQYSLNLLTRMVCKKTVSV